MLIFTLEKMIIQKHEENGDNISDLSSIFI